MRLLSPLSATILALAFVAASCGQDTPTAPAAGTSGDIGGGDALGSWAPVSFTLPSDAHGGDCGLAADIEATGVGRFVLRLSPDGFPAGFTFDSHGRAAGADGATYEWNDAAIAGDFADGFFNEGWSFEIVDHFNLVGSGGTLHVRVFTHGRLVENADGEFVPDGPVTFSGPECDPDLPIGE